MKNKPKCKLIGTDGNVFSLAAKVEQCLKKNGMGDKAIKMKERVFKATSYDQALLIFMEYVEVE
jgi:hypothetical protein